MHELVKSGSATEKGAVIHTYMSGQQTIVCNDDVASDNAIVPDVRAAHKKIFATDFGDAAPGTAAMDRAVLTNDGVVANLYTRVSVGGQRNILLRCANNHAVLDTIVASDRGLPFEHYVRENDGPVADLLLL